MQLLDGDFKRDFSTRSMFLEAPIISADWRSLMIMITAASKSRKALLLFSYDHILSDSVNLLLEMDLGLDSLRLETSNGFFFGL